MHAIKRMFERRISVDQVRQVLGAGEVIEDYPNDVPYPSRLMPGWSGSRPLQVVAADNDTKEGQETIVITVYEPSPGEWEAGFRRRKS
ncbi:MAG: DUF4258 domain-containing protein [Terriglobia bacterium]